MNPIHRPDASVREKFMYSVRHNAWYGPLIIYIAFMVTVSVVLMATGATIG